MFKYSATEKLGDSKIADKTSSTLACGVGAAGADAGDAEDEDDEEDAATADDRFTIAMMTTTSFVPLSFDYIYR